MLYSGTVLGDGKEFRVLFLTEAQVERVKNKYAEKGARFIVDGEPTASDQRPVITKRRVIGRAARTAAEMLQDVKQRARKQGGARDVYSQSVVCVTRKTYHDSISEAARNFSLNQPNLSRHLRGEAKHVGGLVFRYATPDENQVRRCLSQLD